MSDEYGKLMKKKAEQRFTDDMVMIFHDYYRKQEEEGWTNKETNDQIKAHLAANFPDREIDFEHYLLLADAQW